MLQRAAVNPSPVHEVPPIVHEVLHSPGQPLDAQTRSFMEPRFGHDFSGVRVHTDVRAGESAQAVNALAYTVGQDVVFGAGHYPPHTNVGQRLVAHELTHVVQQSQITALAGAATLLGNPADASEDEAARVADRVLESQSINAGTREGFSYDLIQDKEPADASGSRPVGRNPMPIETRDMNPMLRRAVIIPENASLLKITAQPSTGLEIKNLLGKWRARPQTPNAIEFTGSTRANCGPGESASGYEVGIVQVQTREVNNGRYLGSTPADGSVWIRRDIPAVRPQGPCQDSPFGKFWNEQKSLTCGSDVSVSFKDFPQDLYDTIFNNPLTGKPNYLTELHVAFDFTTALMLKYPDASLQTLRWALWDVGWDYTFDTLPSGESKVKKGIAQSGAAEFVGPMPTPAELPRHYVPPAKNCNTIDYEGSDNPARIQASASW